MLIGYQQIASLLKMGAQPDFVPIVIPAKKKLSIFAGNKCEKFNDCYHIYRSKSLH
jgi:hypothetical protein